MIRGLKSYVISLGNTASIVKEALGVPVRKEKRNQRWAENSSPYESTTQALYIPVLISFELYEVGVCRWQSLCKQAVPLCGRADQDCVLCAQPRLVLNKLVI
jgi:hypothetical protein